MPYDRLSQSDMTFLHAETAATPMHVGGLCIFEGGPMRDRHGCLRIDDLRAVVESRLHRAPRFRRRLHEVPFAGRPVWADDPYFDIANHVKGVALPKPGREAQLLELFRSLQQQPLERSRPLWEMWAVDGLEGDRVALVVKVHHSMADGVSMIDFGLLVLDLSPETVVEDAPAWVPAPPPTAAELRSDAVASGTRGGLSVLRSALDAVRRPAELLDRGVSVLETVASTAHLAPRLPINAPVGNTRDFALFRLPLADMELVKRSHATKLNDVVLAAVAGGLRHYLERTGTPLETVVPRVAVPVSLRAEDERGEMGNRVSIMLARLPVGLSNPVLRLQQVHQEMEAKKASAQASMGPAMLSLADLLPAPFLRAATRVAGARQRLVNIVVTNVPGPQFPLYALGGRMLAAYPYVGTTANIGVIVGLISYCGELHVGLSADPHVVPNLDVLAAGIEKSALELVEHS